MLDDRLVGTLVDAVSEILALDTSEIVSVPEINAGDDQRFLSGLVSQDDKLLALLNLEELFDICGASTDQVFRDRCRGHIV